MAAPRGSDDSLPILRPKPQRTWQITPMSTEPPTPRSPSTDPAGSSSASGAAVDDAASKPVPRSRSILNLTTSTLFGIYSSPMSDGAPSALELSQSPPPFPEFGNNSPPFPDFSQVPTPWSAGARTPAYPGSTRASLTEDTMRPLLTAARRVKAGQRGQWLHEWVGGEPAGRQLRNAFVLVALGMVYGGLVAALHDEDAHAIPIRLGVLERHTSWHVAFWGLAAATAGWILPRFDRWWVEKELQAQAVRDQAADAKQREPLTPSKGGRKAPGRRRPSMRRELSSTETEEEGSGDRDGGWSSALRAIGGFVGIVFMIRRLRWDPALQSSLTIGLSNPVLWYVIDGSVTGLLLALVASATGAAAIVGCGPEIVSWTGETVFGNASAYGAADGFGAMNIRLTAPTALKLAWPWGYESVATWTWVASALFYGVVCFGNLGRMLSGSRSWW